MSHKQMPRLGSAIAGTILSLFSAVSLVGVDKAQAAVLHYQFLDNSSNFFKVDNSLLTGIGEEYISVFEGSFYDFTVGDKEYHNLAGFRAVFDGGAFRGLNAYGSDYATSELIISPDQPYGPFYIRSSANASWSISTYRTSPSTWTSVLNGHSELYRSMNGGNFVLADRSFTRNREVDYTLVNTASETVPAPEPVPEPLSEPVLASEPVPEPLTAGGTALALAGLSWLKHKKKKAA
jgi:hypothetical protein